ncbi:MAG: TIGR03936 family radical SAM-associated protein [Spirochaetes bacterium]|nr:TIGR03936 family radical SAM-associated protein [Spirochaetota bacterium]
MISRTIDIGNLLVGIEKPARYTGGELNSIVKNRANVRMAICFPDLYEVGMSNSGIQILYTRVNAIEGIACERVFAPALDLEKRLRDVAIPLFTIETRTPLWALDAIGFNLAHELLLTGMLQVLDLGWIPLKRTERNDNHPLIIAGGECASNPAPYEDFVDAVCVGDGEELITEIAHVLLQSKTLHGGKEFILQNLAKISGIYLPGRNREHFVAKRIYRAKNPSWPTRPIVPNIRIAQAKAVIEVSRGCPNLCSFCHAGFFDLPYRVFKVSVIRDAVFDIINNTGYDELTLASLSISDYPHLLELLNEILPWLTKKGVSISLPSLRVDAEALPLLEKLSIIRKSSLTFAIESASDFLRQRANKRLSIHDMKAIVHRIRELGWRHVKLYFMLGLPGCETVNEPGEIAQLLTEFYQTGRKKLEMNVTLSPFVPKPHTPFEREPMQTKEYFEKAIRTICANIPRGITIKSHDVNASILEGVIARGDEKLSEVIHRAYIEGCRFDSWSEHFRFDTWHKLLNEMIPNWESYLRKRESEEKLPWQKIVTGFEKLISVRSKKHTSLPKIKTKIKGSIHEDELNRAMQEFARKFNVISRARVQFEKLHDARFIPHIDFIEIIKRALRMAGIPVSFTQGFNKRERLSTGFPLPIGVESIAELIDFDLWHMIEPKSAVDAFNQHLPVGIRATRMRLLFPEEKTSLMTLTTSIEYCVRGNGNVIDTISTKLQEYIQRKKEKTDAIQISLDEIVHRWEAHENEINIMLAIGTKNSIRIDTFLASILGKTTDEVLCTMRIVKLAQYTKNNQNFTKIE